jgi:hypothetical protein
MNRLELGFTREIVGWAHKLKWRVAHFRPGMSSKGQWLTSMLGDPGYPDLTIARGRRLIFAELKIPPNKMTDAQLAWFVLLQNVPLVEAYLWTPADFPKIIETLRRE